MHLLLPFLISAALLSAAVKGGDTKPGPVQPGIAADFRVGFYNIGVISY